VQEFSGKLGIESPSLVFLIKLALRQRLPIQFQIKPKIGALFVDEKKEEGKKKTSGLWK